MVSTKLITIREAANRLGLKESTIRKAILKRQIAYVKPSVRAVRIPIEELERILAAGLRPVDSSAGRCPMSRWKEFRREPVAGEWTRKQKRGYHRVRSLLWFWECHQFQVLWVTLSTAEGGDAEKLTYHHKQLRQRIERQLGFRGWSITRSDGRRAWRPPYLLGLAGAGWGTRSTVLDLSGMALVPMAGPPRGSGRLDQGLSAQPSFPEPSQPLRHQPVRPGSMWLREYVLVLEALAWVSHQSAVGRNAASMVYQECLSPDQRRDRNPKDRLYQDLGGSAVGASDLV
jgi:excisionase family DNA binding protein